MRITKALAASALAFGLIAIAPAKASDGFELLVMKDGSGFVVLDVHADLGVPPGAPCTILADGILPLACVPLFPGDNLVMVPSVGQSYTAVVPGCGLRDADDDNIGIN